jgi:hypothetical protein
MVLGLVALFGVSGMDVTAGAQHNCRAQDGQDLCLRIDIRFLHNISDFKFQIYFTTWPWAL